ncbi:NAD(P)-dependent dehydrogenase (short-subunit alcohol dehydrogenase family) [Sphingobium jiangsuense]|uniref:NAD(P)-dependent dehydrogenase (Short-subunit alcohol dehydrogenase family) n=1 Tax=Sphingobium jiangsuense TaxID=870476 RepID=A0A7W6BNI8_9SPHN|nr:SDR family oxidoreductase [Sphingobium jiangsuense]MBB3928412.1 NAD(P)-dependent dehydrogenase (short-subunit alcohol dehydrogenase family) [Sphingobium jiangsuense]
MARLSGKTALVMGASGRDNMGQVIARRLVDEGAKIVLSGRRLDELERFAGEIGGSGIAADITSKADNDALAAQIGNRFGGVDIVVNATGWGLLKPFELTTEEELRRMVDLQFVGPFLFFQSILPQVREGGSLIQISSATATIMLDDHAAYMGTKAGFDHVMRCLANEYGRRGIRANSVSPGFTETPMTAGAAKVPGLLETYASRYPLGRVGRTDDIADAVAWLASDGCFMSGQNLQVNGGLTLRGNPSREEIDAAVMAATGRPRPRPWGNGRTGSGRNG